MREIIKNRTVVADDWTVLRLPEGEDQESLAASIVIPEGKVIVPLAVWKAQRDKLQGRANLGVWLASSERPEELKGELGNFQVIGVDFPKFADGRGYSIAYNLRARLGYTGELRAIGDVLRDQLFYMHRVGFDAFAVREDKNIHDALKGLTDFSETYQSSWDQKNPLFRRARRAEASA
ncbi:MAG: oxidoreductase [Noviherbaspirillum sp.]|nr:oxidoreductase [Noviherbaspirillum sp.]